ncbi:hypothetical protein Tco_0043628, partial [Tanacetum coccineum]
MKATMAWSCHACDGFDERLLVCSLSFKNNLSYDYYLANIAYNKVDYSFVDTVDVNIQASERRTMAAIKVVNLRVSYQADVHRRESEEFYTRHQDAQRDRAALCDEVDTLSRYLSSLCTTRKQERVEVCQALDRSEDHNRALEARIVVLETQAYHHEWQ